MLHVTQRKAQYALLAELFSYPEETLPGTLAKERTADLARLLGLDVPGDKVTLEALQTRYTDLFINRLGGVPAPPYGSVYLDGGGRILGESTARVAEAYAARGLSAGRSGEPADHLAIELEYLYYLVDCEEQALARGDLAASRRDSLEQARFGATLFFPWIPEFCRRLSEASPRFPYDFSCELLKRFCAAEADWLRRLHPEAFPS